MTRRVVLILIATVVLVVNAIVQYIKDRREHKENLRRIEQETADQVRAIQEAGIRIQERIRAGRYANYAEMKNDLAFEQIIRHLDK